MAKKRRGERPDGLIQVALEIGTYPDGRRRRKYFYGHTRAEANAKKEAYRQHRESGSKFKQDITVAEWVGIYKDTYRQNVDAAYLSSDDVPYNRLVNEIGDMFMREVTESDLQRVLNKTAGKSFSTCEKYRQAIKRVFDRARKNKIIPDNPAEDLILPPYSKGSHRALEAWEVELIIAHWNEPGLVAGLWVMLMLLAGLRRGEMMALDWSSVDLNNRLLRVERVAVIHGNQTTIEERAKTEAGLRTIPICQPLYAALESIPKKQRKGFVCLSAHGKQLSESAVSRGITSFCAALERLLNGENLQARGKRTDLDRKKNSPRQTFSFRTHDLRHTFCTMLYTSGVDVKTAAYLMGHADIRVTMAIYTHLSNEKRDASQALMLSYFDQLDAPKD